MYQHVCPKVHQKSSKIIPIFPNGRGVRAVLLLLHPPTMRNTSWGFGPKPIRSEYEIESSPGADYVACHHTFLGRFDSMLVTGGCAGRFAMLMCLSNFWSNSENFYEGNPINLCYSLWTSVLTGSNMNYIHMYTSIWNRNGIYCM